MSAPIALSIGDEAIAEISIDQAPSLEIQKPESKSDISIFYVDDDQYGLQTMVPLMLGTRGFDSSKVTAVKDAVSALDTLARRSFDIAIFDGHLVNDNTYGWEVLAQARQAAIEQGKDFNPRVILFTGDSTKHMKESALNAAQEQGMIMVGDKDMDSLLDVMDELAEELLA